MVKRTNASADFCEHTVDLFVKDVLAAAFYSVYFPHKDDNGAAHSRSPNGIISVPS